MNCEKCNQEIIIIGSGSLFCTNCGKIETSDVGSKYTKVLCKDKSIVNVDVYDVLKIFKVHNPATAHAIKKLLMPGNRGYKDRVQDLEEAIVSIKRAIELERNY